MENRQYREPSLLFQFLVFFVIGVFFLLKWLVVKFFKLLRRLFPVPLRLVAGLLRPFWRGYTSWLKKEWKLELAYREVDADWQMYLKTRQWPDSSFSSPISELWLKVFPFLVWVTRNLGRSPLMAREEKEAKKEARR